MAPAFLFKLGAQDLSQYVRVSPQDSMDPYGGGDWADPQFSDAPFAEGRPLLNIDTNNREMVWPLFLKGTGSGSGSYAAVIVADSPISYWRLGESAGTTATDVQGANNGTYTNSPTLGATGALSGDANTAVTFAAGSSQYVLCKSGVILGTRTTFSIEAWVKSTATSKCIYSERAASGNDILKIEIDGNGKLAFTYRDDAGTLSTVTSSGSINNGNYHHVVATVTIGGTCNLYIDGSSDGSGAIGGTTTFTNAGIEARIAADKGDGTQFMTGTEDEVALYGSILTPTQVTTHRNAGLGIFGGVTTAKDNLHTVVQNIVREINNPTSSPLRVEWKDQGASNSTFYDVTYARWDPHFNYRLSEHAYADGAVRVWCQPPYGHTATEWIIATAAGTAPGLTASLLGVASPLVGDVAPQLRVTVNTSGEAVGPAGRGVIISAPQASGYQPFISAASFVSVHPSAGVFGASGAPGSQAIYRHPFGDSGRLAQVGLGATMYAGRNRVFAAVLPAAFQVGMSINAVDQAGAAIGASAMAYRADGWQVVDLGVVNVPTSTPTTTLNLYTDQPYRTLTDYFFQRPPASGAAASSVGAVAGVYVLPENNTQAIVDTNAKTLARGWFGASGAPTALFPQNYVGERGETWQVAIGTAAIFNDRGVYLLPPGGGGGYYSANTESADNFRSRSISHPISGNPMILGGLVKGATQTYLVAQMTPGASVSVINLQALVAGATVLSASLVLASQAGMPAMPGASQGLIVDVERRDRVVVLNARLSTTTGIAYIPSAGMAATVVPVACVAATSALLNSLVGQPFFGSANAANTFSYYQFDKLLSVAQPSEAYRITSVSGDTPLRSPIAGSGPNVNLAGAKKGPDLKLSASQTGIVTVDWQLDGGPMNDPMGVEVRVRDRFTYAR